MVKQSGLTSFSANDIASLTVRFIAVTLMVFLAAGSSALAKESQCGEASWYGNNFAGKPTASGEIYDPTSLTAAHRTLRFGTRVRVREVSSGNSVIVRINNRGPFVSGRIIDLSSSAADRIGYKRRGVTRVCIKILSRKRAR